MMDLIAYRADDGSVRCGQCHAHMIRIGSPDDCRWFFPFDCKCWELPPPCEATAAPEIIEDE